MALLSQRKGGCFLTVCLVIAFIEGSLALTCLDCQNAGSLQDCTKFTECADDEACFIEKYLNQETFEIVHRAGCRNIHDCKLVECNKEIFGTTESTTSNTGASSLNTLGISTLPTTKHVRLKRDLVVCTQCCYNDTCNTNGCGSNYYDENETTLHCFSQDKVITNETVQTVIRCQSNELCFHTAKIFVGSYGYTLGCLSKRMCDFLAETAKNQGTELATKCCDTPLCNVNPISQKLDTRNITQQLACPTALVKTTTPTTVSPTTPTTHITKAPTPPSATPLHVPTPPSSSRTPQVAITQPLTSTTQSTSTTQGSTSTTQGSTSTTQPSTSTTTRPTTTTTMATTSTTQPSTSTTQPSTSTTQPSTSTTTKPNSTTTMATTSTTQPSTSTTQPSTSTTQPSTSTTTNPTSTTTKATTSTTQPSTSTIQLPKTSKIPVILLSTTLNTSSTSTLSVTTRYSTATNAPSSPIIRTPTVSLGTKATPPNFTAVPNTTLVPQPTTLKDIATLPPTTTRCYKCAGPPESCDLAIYEDDCVAPDNYCINHVINQASGDKLIDRGCGNVQRCYKDWYLGSSDDDKCRQLTGDKVLTYDFECTYCCTKDSCNFDLHPKQDTLYSPTK